METISSVVSKVIQLVFAEYNRKSSEAKERQALSIPDQHAECTSYKITHDLEVKYRFQESKTAFKPHKREQFDKMIALIESGACNSLLVWKEERICRNPEEGGKVLQLLQDGKIKCIVCVSSNTVYTPESDHLILQIHFGMANQFSRNLSQNVRRGLNRKVHDRKQYPRPAFIGYEGFGERGHRDIQQCPVEAAHIVKAFELAAKDYSLGHIAKQLKEAGFRTKRGKEVGKSHLQSILSNPRYYGYFYHNGELCEGNYDALISKGHFDLVQQKLRDRSRAKKIIWSKEFLNLIKCGVCGCSVIPSFKTKYIKKLKANKTFIYHRCTRRRGNCHEKPITDFELKDMLYKEISRIIIDEKVWDAGMKLVRAKNHEEIEKNKRQLQYIHQQAESVRTQISRIIDMRSSGELTKDEFIQQKQRLTEKLANMDNKTNDNSHSVKTWLELMEEFLNTAFQALETVKSGTFEERQSILRRIGENFLLKDKKLVFSFRKPYDVLLQQEVRTNVLRDMDSNHDTQFQRLRYYHYTIPHVNIHPNYSLEEQ